MLYEIMLDIIYSPPAGITQFTSDYPDLDLHLWCNSWLDVITLTNRAGEKVEFTTSDLESYFGRVSLISPPTDSSPLMFKLVSCAPRPIDEILPKFDCMELPPAVYEKERERIHLLISSGSGSSFVEEVENLNTVENVVVKKLSPFKSSETKYPVYLSISDVMSQLTQRQIHSLILALKGGYYEIPRQIGTEELAKKFDISRRTFEEHLRKAEKKLVENFVPLMLFNVSELPPHK